MFLFLCTLQFGAGLDGTYRLAYGTLGLMSCAISGTFLWLWRINATPLATGMVLSWAGGGGMLGWWWCYALLDGPLWMSRHPALLAFASVYLVGAGLHFAVIGSGFGFPKWSWMLVVAVALGLALTITVLTGLAFSPM
ncbi:hypothetical protein [Palleronia sp. THAF1]|uniref:hypothetical protein n=1 Tax=Palleronia sp. THAF1 TaxID=2587842 RepID=UPI000F5264F4|nr:hypothetical protein [Palleronia sp. THAF1]